MKAHLHKLPQLPRRPWFIYLVAMGALTAAYVLAHYLGVRWLNSGPVFNIIGGSTVLALIIGARRNSQSGRLPWYLIALGQACFVIGDVLAYNYTRFFGGELPTPSIAVAHLARAQDMHSDFGQGFYFAKPLTAEEVMAIAAGESQAGATIRAMSGAGTSATQLA